MDRMKELVKLLNKYAYHYYVLDNPIVADKDYDVLYDELVALEKQTGVILPDSITQRIGGQILSKFTKVNHISKLYSLDKAQSFEELKKWYDGIKKVYDDALFTLSYKLDGLTIVCEYENGYFVRAATRGNGTTGEDVTAQVRTINTVPLSINYKGKLIVHGEAMMTLSNLEKYNKTSDSKLKNARNAVAGAIRNLDPKQTAKRNLDWWTYAINYIDDNSFLKTQQDVNEFLISNGFKMPGLFEVAKNFEEIKKIIEKVDKQKDNLDFLIDGVVLNVNSLSQRQEFGYTTKFPKWALAFKFEAMEVTSILKEVLWQVGRTGKVTPIAVVEPVELAGATVQRATLNNIDDIRKKQLEVGSRVFIRRSNEVIPEILSLAESLPGAKKIEELTNCPSCGQKLSKKNMNLYCTNYGGCYSQIIERMSHFASKEAMNIEGFSSQTIKQIYDNLNVKYLHDLYNLKKEDLLALEGIKEKKAQNIVNSIEASKKIKLSNFLYSLGILNVGVKTSKDLAKHFVTLENLTNATKEELAAVRDIGEITAESIADFFEDEHNNFEIQKLFESGIKVRENVQKQAKDSVFSGKTVVLTGSFENLTRQQATQMLEDVGANVTKSVSKKTNYVIFGKEAGSKLDKAKALGVETLSEQDVFGKMLK